LTIRPNEVWSLLGISHETGYKWIREGRLKVTRVGSVTLIHVESLRALLVDIGGAE